MNLLNKIISFLVLVFVVSCSTEKNTMITRTYHNLTSNYNIYFNGYESFQSGIERVEKGFIDDYSKILPLLYYSDPGVSQTVSSDMDRAIEKATKVITLHSISAKPDLKRGAQTEKQKDYYNKKEYNKWIDDNYLLMAKAYIYKNDYPLALETLRKVVTDFPEEKTRYEAMIWMARAYNETKEYRESEQILQVLDSNEEFPDNMRSDLYITYSDLYLKQGNPEKAATMLEKAVGLVKKKHYVIRYTYILAQLYQQTGKAELAVENYRKVIKMNPPYEMTFNAKINMAGSFSAGSGKGKEIEGLLLKMLKDEKNKEFQDQIYYALGNISMKGGDEKQGIEYFLKSIKASVNNFNQKGLSYLALGDIYYLKPDYELAQAYYDSTVQNINPDYENFDELEKKAGSLTKLVQHLNIYQLEDSLQILARLPEAELFTRIDGIIAEVRKKEEEEKLKQQEGMLDMQYSMMNSGSGSSRSNLGEEGGKWYFYNPSAKGFGQPEFRMKWGNRRLEDDWRRNSKQSVEFETASEEEGDAAETVPEGEQKILSNKTREFYIQHIPRGDSAMEQSNLRLEQALYEMGLVYRNDLGDNEEAIKIFEEQLSRYSDGKNSMMGAFNLYELYNSTGDKAKSDFYKNLIVRKYPDNPRAKILSDPGYAEQLLNEANRVNVFYEQTYDKYEKADYNAVITDVNYALTEFSGDKTIPRFRLLKALSTGGIAGKEAMKEELDLVISDYPGHEVSAYATQLIDHIYSMAPELKVEDTRKAAEEIYSYKTDGQFFAGISGRVDLDKNQLNFNLINFNLDFYNRENLSLEQLTVGKRTIIIVRSFKDQEAALSYLSRISENQETVFNSIDQSDIELFIIGPENFNTLVKDNDFAKYRLFYQKYF